jgi:hypothetical protein
MTVLAERGLAERGLAERGPAETGPGPGSLKRLPGQLPDAWKLRLIR